MTFNLKHWIRKNDGSVSVEFAMVGLGFVFLMVGILEMGRLAWTYNVVDYAVDEAARYAVLHQDASDSEVEQYAQDMLKGFFVPTASLNISVGNTNSSGVDFIEITGTYDFKSMTHTLLPDSLSSVTFDLVTRRPVYSYPESDSGEGV